MLCKYRFIFGKPGEGAHSYRFMNLAIVDVLLTIIAGYLLSRYFRIHPGFGIGGLFLLGIIAHRLFCVRTTIDKLLPF
jgi:F0F1-type ATP synthase assembly protein I